MPRQHQQISRIRHQTTAASRSFLCPEPNQLIAKLLYLFRHTNPHEHAAPPTETAQTHLSSRTRSECREFGVLAARVQRADKSRLLDFICDVCNYGSYFQAIAVRCRSDTEHAHNVPSRDIFPFSSDMDGDNPYYSFYSTLVGGFNMRCTSLKAI